MRHLAPAKWGRQMDHVFCATVVDCMVCPNLCFGLKNGTSFNYQSEPPQVRDRQPPSFERKIIFTYRITSDIRPTILTFSFKLKIRAGLKCVVLLFTLDQPRGLVVRVSDY